MVGERLLERLRIGRRDLRRTETQAKSSETGIVRGSGFSYSRKYDSRDLHGTEDPRPWDMSNEILSRWNPNGQTLVDVGVGPAKKMLPLAVHIPHIIGIDINAEVIQNAAENVRVAGVENVRVLVGDANALPLQDGSVDMITYMLAPQNAQEAYRVLKPGGIMIVERVAERDKANIKDMFGLDSNGQPRGYRSELPLGAVGKLNAEELQQAGFTDVTTRDGYWNTWFTPESLRLVLKETPTVRNYDEEKDAPIVEEIIQKFSTDKGIQTEQHRVLVIGKKPL